MLAAGGAWAPGAVPSAVSAPSTRTRGEPGPRQAGGPPSTIAAAAALPVAGASTSTTSGSVAAHTSRTPLVPDRRWVASTSTALFWQASPCADASADSKGAARAAAAFANGDEFGGWSGAMCYEPHPTNHLMAFFTAHFTDARGADAVHEAVAVRVGPGVHGNGRTSGGAEGATSGEDAHTDGAWQVVWCPVSLAQKFCSSSSVRTEAAAGVILEQVHATMHAAEDHALGVWAAWSKLPLHDPRREPRVGLEPGFEGGTCDMQVKGKTTRESLRPFVHALFLEDGLPSDILVGSAAESSAWFGMDVEVSVYLGLCVTEEFTRVLLGKDSEGAERKLMVIRANHVGMPPSLPAAGAGST